MLVDTVLDSAFFKKIQFIPEGSIWAHGEFSIFIEQTDRDILKCFTIEDFKFNFHKSIGLNVKDFNIEDNGLFSYTVDKMEDFQIEDSRNILKDTMYDFNDSFVLSKDSFTIKKLKVKFKSILNRYSKTYLNGDLNEEENVVVSAIYSSLDALNNVDFSHGKSYRFDLHLNQFIMDYETEQVYCSDLICEI